MELRTPTVRDAIRGTLLVAGLLASGVGLFLDGGRIGVAVAFVGVAVALLAAGFYGVAMLHLGAIAVVDTPSIAGLALLEAAALFLVVADVRPGRRLEVGTLFVPISVLLAVGTVSLARRSDFVAASVALVAVVALGTYLLHRYAAVRFGAPTGGLDR